MAVNPVVTMATVVERVVHELLLVDDNVRELIHGGRGELAIEKYIRQFVPSIRHDGMSKVLAGITTLEEVLRVTREE